MNKPERVTTEPNEAQKFDAGVRKILSVSHDELLKREQEWKRKRATKAKPGPKGKIPG